MNMKNSEGYPDPTSFKAIQSIDNEHKRVRELLRALRQMCEKAGYRIEGRIELVNIRSGRRWR